MDFVKMEDLDFLEEYVYALSGEVVIFCGFYKGIPLFHRRCDSELISTRYVLKLNMLDYNANKNIYSIGDKIND